MRNDGDFKINRELHLSNERLMSNLVYDIVNNKNYKLLDKYNVVKIIFRVKKSIAPLPLAFTKKGFDDLVSFNLLKKYLGITHISKYYPFLDYALSYLENKIPKLKEQYPQLFSDDKGVIKQELFNTFLQEDKSHITKKIRQTLNFIKHTYNNNKTPWNKPTNEVSNHLSIKDFIEWIKICDENYKKLSPIELMNYALPGFFNVDFELKTENSKEIYLSQLSSGEQQMIFNINSITYHLYNLQSIHTNEKTKGLISRVKYKNIAVILDEIELYYHPNMQRELVKNILQSFELIKNIGEAGIESINLSFLTHSPFILSDIPTNNILRLSLNDNGESIIDDNNSKTFGANIHDLLVDSFFMPSTTGEFAQIKIKEIVDFYYRVKSNEIEKHVLLSKYKEKQKEFHYILNIIGEDVIRGIIENHIQFIEESLLDNNKKSMIERLEEEIILKRNEIKRLTQDD
jgi:predicted ATP-binding protein involved in virulence